MTKRIVFTGGGTAGHVIPNLPLIEAFQSEKWAIDYLGSQNGIEKKLIENTGTPFHAISSGKLRRYFSWQNLLDPFKILAGILQSTWLLMRIKPHIVFSKGGFVAFPVVVGAWINRIPVVAHESDMSIGLTNKLCFPFVQKMCVTFDAAKNQYKTSKKVVVTGTPLREALLKGDRMRGLELCGFKEDKPCLLVIGGSLGAQSVNKSVRDALPILTQQYQVIHLCGAGNRDAQLDTYPNYFQCEFANQELADFFACSELIISRSGANSLYEILTLKKPHVLIPLSTKMSRGDQMQNATYFQKLGISVVIKDEDLNKEQLLEGIAKVLNNKEAIVNKIETLQLHSATDTIKSLLQTLALDKR